MADNNWKGIEFNGVGGAGPNYLYHGTKNKPHMYLMHKRGGFDGGWGSVALIRPLFIGHDLPCPNCDRSAHLVHWGTDPDNLSGAGGGVWGDGTDGWGGQIGGWDGIEDWALGCAQLLESARSNLLAQICPRGPYPSSFT